MRCRGFYKIYSSNEIIKLCTVRQAVDRYKIGRTSLMQLAERENAVRRFGRSVRIDVEVLDKAIEQDKRIVFVLLSGVPVPAVPICAA